MEEVGGPQCFVTESERPVPAPPQWLKATVAAGRKTQWQHPEGVYWSKVTDVTFRLSYLTRHTLCKIQRGDNRLFFFILNASNAHMPCSAQKFWCLLWPSVLPLSAMWGGEILFCSHQNKQREKLDMPMECCWQEARSWSQENRGVYTEGAFEGMRN